MVSDFQRLGIGARTVLDRLEAEGVLDGLIPLPLGEPDDDVATPPSVITIFVLDKGTECILCKGLLDDVGVVGVDEDDESPDPGGRGAGGRTI